MHPAPHLDNVAAFTSRATCRISRPCLIALLAIPSLLAQVGQRSEDLPTLTAKIGNVATAVSVSDEVRLRRVAFSLDRAWLIESSVHDLGIVLSPTILPRARVAPWREAYRKRAVFALTDAAADADAAVRSAALLSLARMREALSYLDLVMELDGADDEVAVRLLLALGTLGRSDALPYLSAIAADRPIGRRTLGVPSKPISAQVRAAAALALGLLEPTTDDCLHDLVVRGHEIPEDVRLAAIAALGLRDEAEVAANAEREDDSRRQPYGPPLRKLSATEKRLDDYLALMDAPNMSAAARSTLMIALARSAPRDHRVRNLARTGLGSDDVLISRASAAVIGYLALGVDPSTRAVLARRVADGLDTQTAGLALIALAECDAPEVSGLASANLDDRTCLAPYAALALLIQSIRSPSEQVVARDVLRQWMEAVEPTAETLTGMVALEILGGEALSSDPPSMQDFTAMMSRRNEWPVGAESQRPLGASLGRHRLFDDHPGRLARAVVLDEDGIDWSNLLDSAGACSGPARIDSLTALGILFEERGPHAFSRLRDLAVKGAETGLFAAVDAQN